MDKESKLIEVASSYVGTKEEGGDNKGPQVEEFQQTLGNPAVGQSWCADFIHYCAKKVDAELGGDEYVLYKSQLVLDIWNKTDAKFRLAKPEPGCAMLWEHLKDGKRTGLGHAGIVTSVSRDGSSVMTVEGNTSDGSGINRNGDGCYARQRPTVSSANTTMRVLGWIKVWDNSPKELLPSGPTEDEINLKLEEIENQ